MQSRIKEIVSSSARNDNDSFIMTVLRIMDEFGYTYREVLDLPIPAYIVIVEYIIKKDKEKKKHGKK